MNILGTSTADLCVKDRLRRIINRLLYTTASRKTHPVKDYTLACNLSGSFW